MPCGRPSPAPDSRGRGYSSRSKLKYGLHVEIIGISLILRSFGRILGELALNKVDPTGLQREILRYHVPGDTRLDLMAEEIPRAPGLVLETALRRQGGRGPGIAGRGQPDQTVSDKGGQVLARLDDQAVARRIDIAPREGAPDACRAELETAGTEEGIEAVVGTVVRVLITARIVVLSQEARYPWQV